VRVVSLLPSTTEILFAIGAGEEVVGVSADCDWPVAATSRPAVSRSTLAAGGTPSEIDEAVRTEVATSGSLYRLDAELLRELRPDLIVTQDLCAVCAVDVATVDDAVAYLGCTAAVLTVDPGSLDEVLDSVRRLGEATGHVDEARSVVADLRARLEAVAGATRGRPSVPTLVLEWPDPPFGAGHWVPDLVAAAGGEPLLAQPAARSVPLRWEDVAACRARAVVIAPCGFRLDGAAEQATALLATGRLPAEADVWAVDADAAFVRPGPRLVDGVEALAAVLHPSTISERPDLARYVGTTSAKTKPSRSTT
jgi:iron complex transport system substrate-binding protein